MVKVVKEKEPKGGTFSLTTQFLERIYKDTLVLLGESVKVGKTNIPQGLIAQLKFADMLHGGAYAAPINQRPFFMPDPSISPYFAGELRNIPSQGLASYLASFFTGSNAEILAAEIIMDSNVPHVFPKVLSDEAYAKVVILFAQTATTANFLTASTGVRTLIEGASQAFETAKGPGEAQAEREKSMQETLIKNLGEAAAIATEVT